MLKGMNGRALILSALLIAPFAGVPPLYAQQDYTPPMADDPPPEDADGLDLIERGMGMLFQNLWDDIGPDLNNLGDDMSGALSRMAPVLKDLSVLVDDLGNYQVPERLENGDIVIRRKPGAPPPPPVGDSLREFTAPDQDDASPSVPLDPDAPEIEL